MTRNHLTIITFSLLALFSCEESKERLPKVEKQEPQLEIKDNHTAPATTVFLIDDCEFPYISLLERDIAKGNDSCILKIQSKERQINRVEVLNIPVDKSSIVHCKDEYVSVAFACGGPCHSHIFVFIDEKRPNEQYAYVQYIDNYPNIIAHVENEEFEKLIVRNLENGKELFVENSDINIMDFGKMDTMYINRDGLNLEYQTKDEKTKKKVVSLSEILSK